MISLVLLAISAQTRLGRYGWLCMSRWQLPGCDALSAAPCSTVARRALLLWGVPSEVLPAPRPRGKAHRDANPVCCHDPESPRGTRMRTVGTRAIRHAAPQTGRNLRFNDTSPVAE